jgi:hypothetical protein
MGNSISKMKIHFVYAVPPASSGVFKGINNLAFKTGLFPPLYRYGINSLIQWPYPVHAPYSITFHLLQALKKKHRVRLYDLKEKSSCPVKKNELLLVHPFPELNSFPWKNPDYHMIGYKAIADHPNGKAIVISPYNHDLNQVGWLTEIFKLKKDLKFIAICGSYWMKNWDQSPFYDILNKENILRVNMAIDAAAYPFTKRSFSPKNKRKFLYIGRTDYPKNTIALENIAAAYKGFEGGFIGNGNIKGWKKISDFSHLTPEFISQISGEYDFFLSTSEADAQATTVLEHMSMGFGIACTPESGYDYPTVIRLDKKDNLFNCSQIEKIQNMEEEMILEMTQKNRAIVEEEHSWSKFSKEVLDFISI